MENSNFPPVLTVEDLSRLLDKSRSAILADRSRAPHRLPPACKVPGTTPRWLLSDVLDWLAAHREPAASAPAPAPAPRRRGRGRPTKVEQIARAQEKGGVK